MRAKGGPVEPGQPYLVGESGPEWFVPREAGRIIPMHRRRSRLRRLIDRLLRR